MASIETLKRSNRLAYHRSENAAVHPKLGRRQTTNHVRGPCSLISLEVMARQVYFEPTQLRDGRSCPPLLYNTSLGSYELLVRLYVDLERGYDVKVSGWGGRGTLN